MKNIPKKGLFTWRIVILSVLLNIVIISALNNNQGFLWPLIISIVLLVLALYIALVGSPFFLFFNNSRFLAPQSQFELPSPSIYSVKDDLKVLIGNAQCSKPYNINLLSSETWEDINRTPFVNKEPEIPNKIKSRVPNTFSRPAGPVCQIEANYNGYRTEKGNFNSRAFKMMAIMPEVKMIEMELSFFATSNHSIKTILEEANPKAVKTHRNIFANLGYAAFQDAEGFIHFIENLRKLSGGKPVGIRLSVTDKKEFHEICYAIRKTQIIPDFIVVTGSYEKTTFNPSDLLFYPAMPLYEALLFVSQTLESYRLQKDIKVIAAGKIISGFDVLKLLALGANSVRVNNNGFDIPEHRDTQEINSHYRRSNVHHRLMRELMQMMNAGGFGNIKDITLSRFLRRLDVLHLEKYAQPETLVVHTGSINKNLNDKIKESRSKDRKSTEKILLQ